MTAGLVMPFITPYLDVPSKAGMAMSNIKYTTIEQH